MGWFEEQIQQRKNQNDEMFSAAFASMAGVVMGKSALFAGVHENKRLTEQALSEILNYYHAVLCEIPESMTETEDILEHALRPSGIMKRRVNLEEGWYKDAFGAMLGTLKDGSIVALLPHKFGGYCYRNPGTGKIIRVNRNNCSNISPEAYCFYKGFPAKEMTVKDLALYMLKLLNGRDWFLILILTGIVSLIGVFTPMLNNYIFSTVIEYSNMTLLGISIVILLSAAMASFLFSMMKTIISNNIVIKMSTSVESAAMMRALSLPVSFFKEYAAGELAGRIQNMNRVCGTFVTMFLTTGLTMCFSIIYIIQIFSYAPVLLRPAVMIILLTLIISLLTTYIQMKVSRKQMAAATRESSLVYSLLSGLQKIKNAGAEKRAFSKWADVYTQSAFYKYAPPMFLKINPVLSLAVTMIGTIILYYCALEGGVTVAEYMAFNSAYGMVSAAFLSFSGMAAAIAIVMPVVEMIEPLFKTVPETSERKQIVERISGSIELNNVSFRYSPDMPPVLDDFSLKIRAGQYIAIVGKTGCGKSTLMRLLLGFEKPQKGAVYYDGKDMSNFDLHSLRRKIGVVLQNGKLFQGDLYSNIAISAPWLTLDEAWEAAEMAGMADDIRNMPMGMHTLVSEGGGGISGGQKQRILIARAIAPKPRVLMFDEATSALDNITQRIVSNSLDSLKCTRIVIAHRLSTIRQCDRIIVLNEGKIIEDGTYEELIGKNGFFAELVARQMESQD